MLVNVGDRLFCELSEVDPVLVEFVELRENFLSFSCFDG